MIATAIAPAAASCRVVGSFITPPPSRSRVLLRNAGDDRPVHRLLDTATQRARHPVHLMHDAAADLQEQRQDQEPARDDYQNVRVTQLLPHHAPCTGHSHAPTHNSLPSASQPNPE